MLYSGNTCCAKYCSFYKRHRIELRSSSIFYLGYRAKTPFVTLIRSSIYNGFIQRVLYLQWEEYQHLPAVVSGSIGLRRVVCNWGPTEIILVTCDHEMPTRAY